MKIDKNIVLIGFMGSGKTTVGKLLADKIGFIFYDSDDEIIKSEGMEIKLIFDKYGEVYFRRSEKNIIAGLSKLSKTVIATGGGAVKYEENMRALALNGFIVYLKCSVEKILANTQNDDTRPLLRAENKTDVIRDMLKQREPLYTAYCDKVIDVSDISAAEAVEIIEFAFNERYVNKH